MIRLRDFLSLTVAAAAVALAACGGAAAPTPFRALKPASGRWGMTPDADAAWQQVEAAARKEGTLTYYTQAITSSQVPLLVDAFKADYPDIKLDVVLGANSSDIQARISTEQDAKSYVGDVGQMSIRTGQMVAQRGYSEKFVGPAAKDPGVQWLNTVVFGDGDIMSSYGLWNPLWVNNKLVKAEDTPENHMDMVDQKWKGSILWAPPWTDGGGWDEYYFAKKVYGTDWVTKMAADKPVFGTGTAEIMTQLGRGEYAMALGIPGTGPTEQLLHDGQIRPVWLDDFTWGSPSGDVLLKGAPHPNAAKVFLNWWMAESGQEFVANLGVWPNRSDIPLKEDWQKGVTTPKQRFTNLDVPDAEAKAGQQEAASIFKK